MVGPLIVLLIGFTVWKLWTHVMAWTPAFAALLERPVTKAGFLPFMMGLETAGGDFEGRPVLLAVHHKRGRYDSGYLVIGMHPRTSSAVSADALATLRTPEAREALDELEGRAELIVSFDDGWLKARWEPSGFMMFPGPFDAQRWRRVLRAMAVVTRSLESTRT